MLASLGSGPVWGVVADKPLPSFHLERIMAHGFSHLTARSKGRNGRARLTVPRRPPRGGTNASPVGPRPNRPPRSTDASGRRDTIPDGTSGYRGPHPTKPVDPKPVNPKPVKPKRKASVDFVMARRARKGAAVTRGQARKIVKKNIRADKKDRAYKYDFAGDGAGDKDADYGTKRHNLARKKHGYKPVKKNRSNHGGGNGNKGDGTTSADDAGNSQSGDSYGGPQSPGPKTEIKPERRRGYKKVNGKWVKVK